MPDIEVWPRSVGQDIFLYVYFQNNAGSYVYRYRFTNARKGYKSTQPSTNAMASPLDSPVRLSKHSFEKETARIPRRRIAVPTNRNDAGVASELRLGGLRGFALLFHRAFVVANDAVNHLFRFSLPHNIAGC